MSRRRGCDERRFPTAVPWSVPAPSRPSQWDQSVPVQPSAKSLQLATPPGSVFSQGPCGMVIAIPPDRAVVPHPSAYAAPSPDRARGRLRESSSDTPVLGHWGHGGRSADRWKDIGVTAGLHWHFLIRQPQAKCSSITLLFGANSACDWGCG